MIGIFSGRGLNRDSVFAKIDVEFKKHLHVFNNGRNSNALAVFICISLHADENGWAYPSRETIKQQTGISTEAAIASALSHLRDIEIEGQRILEHYRLKKDDGTFGPSVYLIFPDLPHNDFGYDDKESLVLHTDTYPSVDNPPVDKPSMGHHGLKQEPVKQEPVKQDFKTFDEMVEASVKDRETPPLTGEEYKERVAAAIQKGAVSSASMKERWRMCFMTNPNWSNKTYSAVLRKLIVFDEGGQPIETFAEWWKKYDWRGKDGQPPTPPQVIELWPQAFEKSHVTEEFIEVR